MPLTPPPDHFSHLQDVLRNLPMIKRYTPVCLFFPLSTSVATQSVISDLRQGLDNLSTAIPHLKGQVIFEGKTDTSWGRQKVIAFQDHIPLFVKDLSNIPEAPSMAELMQADYPFAMLDDRMFCPIDELPQPYAGPATYQESPERPARVLLVQANLLKDGVVLTFASNHTTMDMNGLGQVICFLAKACRGESYTEDEIRQANQDRRNALPLLAEDYLPGPESNYFMFRPREAGAQLPQSESPHIWAYVKISSENLHRLKQEASVQTIVPYITTNDALSAFFWQGITRARQYRVGKEVSSELNRQLSARRLLGLSDGYLGHMVISVHTHEVDVYDKPMGQVAGHLRECLQEENKIRFELRAMVTMLDRVEDKTSVGCGASLDVERDVILSSHADIKCGQVSFGPSLGMATAVRRPMSAAAPGLVYLMPKDSKGNMAVAVCLREDDMQRMRDDPEFKKYAQYIG